MKRLDGGDGRRGYGYTRSLVHKGLDWAPVGQLGDDWRLSGWPSDVNSDNQQWNIREEEEERKKFSVGIRNTAAS